MQTDEPTIRDEKFQQELEAFQDKPRPEAWWQIYFPLIVGLLSLLVITILLVVLGVGDASVWADISIVFMGLPVFILALLVLATFVMLTYAVFRFRSILWEPLLRLQQILSQTGVTVSRVSDSVTRPFIIVRGFWAGIGGVGEGIRNMFVTKEGLDNE